MAVATICVLICTWFACREKSRASSGDSPPRAAVDEGLRRGEAEPFVDTTVRADDAHQSVARHRERLLADGRLEGADVGLVSGCDGWILITTELDVIWRSPFWGEHALRYFPFESPDRADPLNAIQLFASDLRQHGVELLIAPVPTRPMVYPEAVACDGLDLQVATHWAAWPYEEFVTSVERTGVATVNLLDELRNARTSDAGEVFVRGESHWTGRGVVLAAARMARELRSRGLVDPPEAPTPCVTRWLEREVVGDLVEMIDTEGAVTRPAPERVDIREVLKYTSKDPSALEDRAPHSPVVLIGDSFVDCWSGDHGSLRHQLSAELGYDVDALVVNGGGVNDCRLSLLRETRDTPGYLKTKRVVIWCFSFRDAFRLWRRIPVAHPEPRRL